MNSRVLTPLEQLRAFPEIARKVREGIPLFNIACWLQDDHVTYEGVPREAVVALLEAFKASLPAGEIQDEAPHPLEKWIGKPRAVDVNVETVRLGRMVNRRIAATHDVERRTGMLFDGMRQDLRLKVDLLALPRQLVKHEKKVEQAARRRLRREQREAAKAARAHHDALFPPIGDWDE